MTSSTPQIKSSVASAVSLDDVSLLKRIKSHLSTCDCCRKAILELEMTDDKDK